MQLKKKISYQLIKVNFSGFPRMTRVKQLFSDDHKSDVKEAAAKEIRKLPLPDITGKSIAVTAGSRGIPNCREVIATIGAQLKARGARPFVVPSMGSHGNGTAEGQLEVLESYGMTEASLGMPIRSSMEAVSLGKTTEGVEVFCDKNAYEADWTVVCGRVKPHTDFRGPVESGLCKMMVVGLGKHRGAISFHKAGSDDMSGCLQRAAGLFLRKTSVLFSVAIIDNAYHKTKRVEALMSEDILRREPELLLEAKEAMPRIFLDEIDTLIVDYYGKDISGAGMDPNVTGRFLFAPHQRWEGYPHVKKIAVLRLTDASHGNAAGIGIADYVSHRFAQKLDLGVTYTNSLSSNLGLAKIPMIMNDDLDTI